MNEIPTSITKRLLVRIVNNKLNKKIRYYHVLSIISVLFDELLIDLKAGKEIKIHNLGSIQLKQMPDRKYYNVILGAIMQAKGKKIIRFTLLKDIRKKLTKAIDIDKTFEKDK